MKRLLFLTCVALGCLSLASCINDYDDVLDASDASLTTVTFQVSTNSGTITRADSDVHGTDDANHNEDGIEENTTSSECNYAYIYDTDDYYLGKLQNLELKQNGDEAANYTCTGQTTLMLPTDFKIVFLGNYDSNVHTGVNDSEEEHQILLDTFKEPTTGSKLEELWTPSTAGESTSCPRFNGGISPGEYSDYYIPFYGVHSFSDVLLEEDEYQVVLDEPITLIRSIAKMEVNIKGMENFSLDGYEYKSITATIHNAAGVGYTAPYGVASQADYDGSTIMNPYIDTGSTNTNSWEGYNTTYTTEDEEEAILSEFYLCEQDNSNVDEDDIPYIALTVTATNEEGQTANYTYVIYFADYDENEVDKSSPWNIQRNHLYSFNVTFEEGKIIIECYDWELNFENNTSNFNPNNYYIEIEDGIDWTEHFENNTTPVIDTAFDYDEFYYFEISDGIDWTEHFENNTTPVIDTEFDYDEFLYIEVEDGIDWKGCFENNSTTIITTEKSE